MDEGEKYKKFFEGCTKILDVGCGDGFLGRYKRKNQQLTGIDFDKDVIKKAKKHDKKIVMNVDGNKFPLKTNAFDGVIARNFIEHMEDYRTLMNEVYRVLKPGGKLIVRVPDYRSTNAWNDYTHVRPFTSGSITQLLRDHGFKIVRIEAVGGLPLLQLFGFKFKNKVINLVPFILPALSWTVYAKKEGNTKLRLKI